MQSVVIIILACNNLMADPITKTQPMCQEFPIFLVEDVTNMQCLMHSQIEIAKSWWHGHQDWQIRKITCKQKKQYDKTVKKDI